MERRPSGNHCQSKGQLAATGHDVARGLGFRAGPFAAEALLQQFVRVAVRQRREWHGPRAFGDHEPGQPVAAGDQHQAARRARQQRADVIAVAGVVEQDEHSPPGQRIAQHGRRPRDVAGHAVRADSERLEKPAHRVERLDASSVVVAVQVDVELAVEVVRDPVGPVHGKGGLSDPGHPGNRRDHDGTFCAAIQQGVELGEFIRAADEARSARPKLGRRRGCRR